MGASVVATGDSQDCQQSHHDLHLHSERNAKFHQTSGKTNVQLVPIQAHKPQVKTLFWQLFLLGPGDTTRPQEVLLLSMGSVP